MIELEVKKEIGEKLKEDYFAKTSPHAYEAAMEIVDKINNRQELNPYISYYMKEDLHIRNLLAKAHNILLHKEPIHLEVDQKVNIPSNVYKTGLEPAKILEINKDKYSVLVRPLRERAEVIWIPTDLCKTIESTE